MVQLRFSLFLLLLISVFISCSKMDDSTLAVVDGEVVALDEFTAVSPPAGFADKSDEEIAGAVDDFLKRRLFVKAAFNRGYERDSLVLSRMKSTERSNMMQYVFEKAILGSVLDDEYLMGLYDRTGAEVKARHILIQFQGVSRSQSTRSKPEALALVKTILTRISGGESFEGLASELSEGPSKSKGGDLGWFGWGQMVDAFQQAAFSMKPGEVSDAVETQFGYHIIKVEDRREQDRGSFEEEKPRLVQQARRSKEAEIRKYADEFITKIKADAGFELNRKNISRFMELYSASSLAGKPLDVVLEELNFREPLLSLSGENKNASWIIVQLKSVPPQQRPAFTSENHLISILDQLVFQDLVIKYGYNQEFHKDEAFADKVGDVLENLVYSAFVEKEVTQVAVPTDEELRAFYDANMGERYMDKAKVRVKEIFVKDSLLAVDLKKRLTAGEDIGFLAGRYSERKTGKDNQGDIPVFQEGRYGAMGVQAFKMAPGETSEPIRLGTGFSIVRVEEKIEEQPKPFSSVKNRINNELVNELRNKRSDDLFKELKKEFSVKVNYDAVHRYYKEEQDEELATP
jgi:peptidyl-prolyl cis-trans isomerase C